MAIPVTLPTVNADKTKLLNGRKVVVAFEPTGGTQINFRGKAGNYQQSTQRDKYYVPCDDIKDGLQVGLVMKKATERSFDVTLDEVTQAVLDNFVEGEGIDGKARIWVLDERDAANTAALLSNEFECAATLNGAMPIGDDTVTTFTITIDIIGTFTLTRNGSTTA